MTVRVNGEARHLDPAMTVRSLLEQLGALRDGVAVAVNDELVLRSSWDQRRLRQDDSVEVLSAAPGG
jgi:sulfur carrier protein